MMAIWVVENRNISTIARLGATPVTQPAMVAGIVVFKQDLAERAWGWTAAKVLHKAGREPLRPQCLEGAIEHVDRIRKS
ncbi:hypothetical protein GN244_ATG12660 [Phytophthora infestans]|nr:hypothetical protein GN244_ATG12660 [Phytophthora infestans]KAF4134595.1 hypothetical protein GN958_ATG16220 [Phytophthora infestans]